MKKSIIIKCDESYMLLSTVSKRVNFFFLFFFRVIFIRIFYPQLNPPFLDEESSKMVTCLSWLSKTYKSNRIFQKKSKQFNKLKPLGNLCPQSPCHPGDRWQGCWGNRFSRGSKEKACENSGCLRKTNVEFP